MKHEQLAVALNAAALACWLAQPTASYADDHYHITGNVELRKIARPDLQQHLHVSITLSAGSFRQTVAASVSGDYYDAELSVPAGTVLASNSLVAYCSDPLGWLNTNSSRQFTLSRDKKYIHPMRITLEPQAVYAALLRRRSGKLGTQDDWNQAVAEISLRVAENNWEAVMRDLAAARVIFDRPPLKAQLADLEAQQQFMALKMPPRSRQFETCFKLYRGLYAGQEAGVTGDMPARAYACSASSNDIGGHSDDDETLDAVFEILSDDAYSTGIRGEALYVAAKLSLADAQKQRLLPLLTPFLRPDGDLFEAALQALFNLDRGEFNRRTEAALQDAGSASALVSVLDVLELTRSSDFKSRVKEVAAKWSDSPAVSNAAGQYFSALGPQTEEDFDAIERTKSQMDRAFQIQGIAIRKNFSTGRTNAETEYYKKWLDAPPNSALKRFGRSPDWRSVDLNSSRMHRSEQSRRGTSRRSSEQKDKPRRPSGGSSTSTGKRDRR